MTTPRMFYIMGRAHCGSTFLDLLLGNVDGVVSVGEVLSGLYRGPGQDCTCGRRADECPTWAAAAENYSVISGGRDLFEDAAWLFKESDARKLPQALLASPRWYPKRWNGYTMRQRYLVTSVAQAAHASAVLDSNKEYSRALMLLKMQPEARVIHLHRSPAPTIASRHFRVKNAGTGFRFLKRTYYFRTAEEQSGTTARKYAPEWAYPLVLMLTAAAWSVGMAIGLLIKLRYPRRVLNVRYENLMADAPAELARIGKFLDVDSSDVRSMIGNQEPLAVGHLLGGNIQLRRNERVVFDPSVKDRRRLPVHLRVLTAPFALPGTALRAVFAR